MRLDAVRTGRVIKPVRMVVVGTEGVGKSTFAAGCPSPIFIAAEDGTACLDVARFPEPQTWTDVLDAVDLLANEQHNYKTLVIDTIDWVEPLCWAQVCADGKKASIEDFGFGKGYTAAFQMWRSLMMRLELVVARGLHVILLAHAQVKTFKNPDIEIGDYDRYELKLHRLASGLFKEWAYAVLFANFETLVKRDKENDIDQKSRGRGIFDGNRILHTQRHAAWDAKNRYELPPIIPLSWSAFWDRARPFVEGMTADALALRDRAATLVPELDDADQIAARKWLASASATDAGRLEEFISKMQTKINQTSKATETGKTDKTETKEVSK